MGTNIRFYVAISVTIVASAASPIIVEWSKVIWETAVRVAAPDLLGTVDPVWDFAKLGVTERLLTPGSAVFPKEGKITREGDGRCIIESYVDTQNIFGAEVRMQWAALVFDNGAAGYEFVEVIFNP